MNYRATRISACAAALGLATALAAAPALAEDYDYDTPPPQEQQAAPVSEAKLDQFVTALNEVHAIRNEAAEELEATTDPQDAQEVQQKAQQQMIEAVEEAGLTIEEYNQIATMMGSDPELQERISARLEERG
jgi:DNA-directed RNA polymerase specialized sigma54-like protein